MASAHDSTQPPAEATPRRTTVVITRPSGQSAELVALLERAGFAPFEFPLIDIGPVADTAPLQAAVRGLLARGATEVVLLGSIATGKYVETLLPILGSRLLFPSEFVGRGDMSRGGLLLRCAARGEELGYEPVAGAVRKGRRAVRVGEMK